MRRSIIARLVLAVGMAALSGPASAQQPPAPQSTPGNGPYPAIYEQVPGLPDHVIYRPRDLGSLGGKKLGLYVFGNGGCSADGTSSRNHLLQIASHGYLAIAPGKIPSADAARPRPPQGAPGQPPAQLKVATPANALSTAIDWALRENRRRGSPLYGRIATDQIAASGWSCGGLQAILTAQEPRVKTVIVMNSGVFNEGNPISGIAVDKAMVGKLHGSALYVLGGPTDIAYDNGMDDFRRTRTIPAAVINIPVGHGGTYMQPYGGIGAEVVTNWLDWKLRGDAAAAAKFSGKNCGYCADGRFAMERKKIR